MRPANEGDVNEKALSHAAAGIVDPAVVIIPEGMMLYRLASTYTKDNDQRPLPQNFETLSAFEKADKQWMDDNNSEEAYARLTKGPWWFAGSDLVRIKYSSMETGIPLSDCGRQALAVATFWNNAEFLVEAMVRPKGGLKVYCGAGSRQAVTDPIDGAVHHLTPNPSVTQLFVPGMHLIRNARAWFSLKHRHRLRRGF